MLTNPPPPRRTHSGLRPAGLRLGGRLRDRAPRGRGRRPGSGRSPPGSGRRRAPGPGTRQPVFSIVRFGLSPTGSHWRDCLSRAVGAGSRGSPVVGDSGRERPEPRRPAPSGGRPEGPTAAWPGNSSAGQCSSPGSSPGSGLAGGALLGGVAARPVGARGRGGRGGRGGDRGSALPRRADRAGRGSPSSRRAVRAESAAVLRPPRGDAGARSGFLIGNPSMRKSIAQPEFAGKTGRLRPRRGKSGARCGAEGASLPVRHEGGTGGGRTAGSPFSGRESEKTGENPVKTLSFPARTGVVPGSAGQWPPPGGRRMGRPDRIFGNRRPVRGFSEEESRRIQETR